MFRCPECLLSLRKFEGGPAGYWGCTNCRGKLIGLGALKKLVAPDAAQELLASSRLSTADGRPCPSCAKPLSTLLHEKHPVRVELDICKMCYVLWLDQGEEATLKSVPAVRAQVAQTTEDHKAYVSFVMETARRKEQNKEELISHEGPSQAWKLVPALIGLPVEFDTNQIRNAAVITYLVAALCLLSLLTSQRGNASEFIRTWGFVSNHPFARNGLTFITSFFAHAGWWHLLGNLYFLLVFGDNVEDDLGPLAFITLLFVSNMVGLFGQIMLTGYSDTPIIGASAGVFGVLGYYMVRFPRTKVGLLFGGSRTGMGFWNTTWLRFSAVWLIAAKVALELGRAWLNKKFHTNDGIAHGGHLGGAIVGILAGLYMTSSETGETPAARTFEKNR